MCRLATAINRTTEISASGVGGSVLQLYRTSYSVRSASLATAMLLVYILTGKVK